MRTFIIAVFFLFVASLPSARGDLYKYLDAQGVVRYTYDLAEVPEDQRPQVKIFVEDAPASQATSSEVKEDQENVQEKNGTEIDEDAVVNEQRIEELKQKKKELDKEFADLIEEKYRLLKEKQKVDALNKGPDREAAVAKYNKKVQGLNEKFADFQKRNDDFKKESEAIGKALEKGKNTGS